MQIGRKVWPIRPNFPSDLLPFAKMIGRFVPQVWPQVLKKSECFTSFDAYVMLQ
jgi:hypothetical protein